MLNQITFFTIAVGTIEAILVGAHWALYKTIVRFFSIENRTTLLYLKIIFGLLSVSFVAASVLSARYYSTPVKFFYSAAAAWLGFLFYLLVACLIVWILSYFNLKISPAYLVVLFALAIFIGIYGLAHANKLEVTRLNIKLNNLPSEWKGKTAVWVSDIHLGQVRGTGFSRQVTDQINSLNPEVVFVGGDLFDGVSGNYQEMAAPFSQIKAPMGIYFVTGNHEEFDEKTEFVEAAESANMKLLDNEMVELNGIQLIGVDYKDTSNRKGFRNIMDSMNIDKKIPSILLKHSPYYVEESEKYGVDLQLSGHSHQGQFFPVQYISRQVFYGYEFGLHRLGHLLIYISSGAGTWGPPLRVGTNSEIVQINFE